MKPEILIVEDESIIAIDIQEQLKRFGYKVLGISASGEDALQRIQKKRPNLILMDIKLKGKLNGIETAEKASTIDNIPVVYTTANADRATVERAKKTDAYGFIYKPIQPDVLQAVIELALYKHQSELKLMEREAWLAATLQSIGDAVIATDSESQITFMNPVAEKLTGWNKSEYLQKPLTECFKIINAKTRKAVANPVDKVLKTGQVVGLGNDTILVAKDGSEYQIADSASPILDPHKHIIGVVLVFRDVTKSYATQEALKQSESLLANVFNSIQDGISILDKDLNILRVNPVMKNWYKDQTPLENKKCYLCYQNRHEPCDPCPSKRALTSGKTEYNIVPGPENSTTKWIELFSFPIKGSHKNEISGVVEFVRNVTEKKEAQDKLEKHIQQINALHLLAKQVSNSSSLAYVIEASLDGIMSILKPDLVMLFVIEEDQLILQGERFTNKKFSHHDTPVLNIDNCLCGFAVTEKKPQYSKNIHQDSKCTKKECKNSELQSFAALPLINQNKVIGVLSIASSHERDFSIEDIFVETLANEISTGLQNANLFKALNKQVATLEKEILERMQVENALRISEERFRRLSENSPDIIYRISLLDGLYEYINPAVETISGYTPEAFYENKDLLFELLTDDYKEYFLEQKAKLFKGDVPEYYEFKITDKNGHIHWINQRNVLIKDDNGKPVAIEGIATDITAQKQAINESIEARCFLETALANSPSGILIADAPDVKIRIANAAAFNMRQADTKILTGIELKKHATNWQTYHPDGSLYKPEDLPLSRAILKGETVVGEEVIIQDESGNEHWVSANASPILDQDGNVISGIVIFSEITDIKMFNETIVESNNQLEILFDQASDPIYVSDIHGQYLKVNQQACKMTLYSEDELLRMNVVDLDRNLKNKETFQKFVKTLTKGGSTSFESIHKRKDGNEYPVELTVGLLETPHGKRIMGIARDITERKQIESEREKLIQELENKNAELERFTYTVSHDLKSPMITISGFLDVLLKDIKENNTENIQSDYRQIKDAVKKMDKLLKDILELSRIGRIVNPPKMISFNKIVENALSLTRGVIELSNVQVNVQDKMPDVFVDSIRIQEVMTNLIENAVKFQSDNHPIIEIGSQKIKGQHTFFVKDNGIGIQSKYHNKVFKLFDKLDPNSEGSGVGLALVKRIIEVHHGKIWIESTGQQKGTIFYFTLPTKPIKIEP